MRTSHSDTAIIFYKHARTRVKQRDVIITAIMASNSCWRYGLMWVGGVGGDGEKDLMSPYVNRAAGTAAANIKVIHNR